MVGYKIKRIGFLVLLIVLTGCQPFSSRSSSEDSSQRMKALRQWSFEGKYSVNFPTAASGGIRWKQDNHRYEIIFYGPLHLGGARLTGDSASATFCCQAGKPIKARSPEALLQEQLGFSFPLSQLPDWVVGRSSSHHSPAQEKWDEHHHLVWLQDQEWLIHLSGYRPVGTVELPTRLEMTQGSRRVKLVILSWQLDK